MVLLLVADQSATTWSTARLPSPTGPVALPAGGTIIRVERLPDARARELAEKITQRIGAARSIDVEAIVREAQGYPLFPAELVRYHAAQGEHADAGIGLDEALYIAHQRARRSPPSPLHVVTLAPAAVTAQGTATRAAGIQTSEAIKHIKHLKAAHPRSTTVAARVRPTSSAGAVPRRVRGAVQESTADDAEMSLHRKLALRDGDWRRQRSR